MEQSGYDVFLSYSHDDKAVVMALARLLESKGIKTWLDKRNLTGGTRWREEIEKALETCATFAVCIGPNGIGKWQNREIDIALNRETQDPEGNFLVVPVLLPETDPKRVSGFLNNYSWISFEKIEDNGALQGLIDSIRRNEPAASPGGTIAEEPCPYRGLEVFDITDSAVFFGREELIQRAIAKWDPTHSDNRFLGIVGPSGSGKSSLALAGILASLKSGKIRGSDAWPVVVCRPTEQPLNSLAKELARAVPVADTPSTLRKLIHDLGEDTHMLDLTASWALGNTPPDHRLVVLVDQFEEVFTQCREGELRRALIENLLHAATTADGRAAVILTLRSDFYGRCADFPDFAEVLSDRQILVGAMTVEELRRAIEQPAAHANCDLEPGLIDRLLEDVAGQPGCLPLLQHALLQLWQRGRKARLLTHEDYAAIGGVKGALERYAAEIYESFTAKERKICRRVFLRLIQPGEGTAGATRRHLFPDELAQAAGAEAEASEVETVVGKLVRSRLLTTDEEKPPKIELAHEALITSWKELRDWIDEERRDLRIRQRLEAAVRDWEDNDRDPRDLDLGAWLAVAEEWAQRHPGELIPAAKAFLAASIAQHAEESRRELAQAQALAEAERQRADEQTRARQQLKRRAVGLAALLVLAFLASLMAWYQRSQSETRRRIVLAGDLARQARNAADPTTGLLLAVKAAGLARRPETEGALREALARTGGSPMLGASVRRVAASADRRWLVAIGNDGAVYRWDLAAQTPKEEVLPFRLEEPVLDAALSADGNWLLIDTGELYLTSLSGLGQTYGLQESWPRHEEPFSPDGRWLAATLDAKPVLRDLSKGGSVHPFDLPEAWPLTFSPAGSRLALALGNGGIEIRDLDKSGPPIELPDSRGSVQHLAFSPDGGWLAAVGTEEGDWAAKAWRLDPAQSRGKPLQDCKGSQQIAVAPGGTWAFLWDGPVGSCLWDLETGRVSRFPSAKATTAAFSANGRWLAWGEEDGAAYLLDLKQPDRPPAALPRQAAPVRFLLFSQRDRWLILQGGDEPPRQLNPQRRPEEETLLLRVPPREILAVTADGKRLASGQPGQPVKVRSVDGSSLPLEIQGSEPSRAPWVFSPRGDALATGGGKGKLFLWLLARQSRSPLVASFEGGSITTLSFSPDGRWLAFGDDRTGAWLWEAKAALDSTPTLLVRDPAPTALAFNSGPRPIAAAWANGKVDLLSMGGDEQPSRLGGPLAITALAFDPKGEWLAMARSDHKILLRRPQDKKGSDLESQDGDVHLLNFSPDGRWLASGGTGGLVQLWKFGEGDVRTPIVWHAHFGAVQALAFEGNRLVTAGADGTIRGWELSLEKLKESACKAAGRNLTAEEWKEHVLEEPYEKEEPCRKFGQT